MCLVSGGSVYGRVGTIEFTYTGHGAMEGFCNGYSPGKLAEGIFHRRLLSNSTRGIAVILLCLWGRLSVHLMAVFLGGHV